MYGLAEIYSETTASNGRRDVDEVVSINKPHQETSIRSQSVFTQFCREKLNLEIRPGDIVNCHRLQKSTQSIHRPMVIRLASQRVRAEILNERRRLRASNIYINEHLTRNVSGMFKSARKMLRDKLIVGAWTRGG